MSIFYTLLSEGFTEKINTRNQLLRREHMSVDESDKVGVHFDSSAFSAVCRKLVNAQSVSVIMNFMAEEVFPNSNQYNLPAFHKLLCNIRVNDNQDLSELCAEYYLSVLETEKRQFEELKLSELAYFIGIDSPGDLYYAHYPEKGFRCGNSINFICKYEAKSIYGIKLDAASLCMMDVDRLASAIEALSRKRIEEKESIAAKQNQEAEEYEESAASSNIDLTLPRVVVTDNDSFSIKYGLVGGLFTLYQMCGENHRQDLCSYILTQYVFPVMELVPWESGTDKVKIIGALFSQYSYYIYVNSASKNPFSSIKHLFPKLSEEEMKDNRYYSLSTSVIEEKDLYDEILYENGLFETECKQNSGVLADTAVSFGRILLRGEKILEPYMSFYYSFFLAYTFSVMFFCEKKEDAVSFLLRCYSSIKQEDRRLLLFQVTMIKAILNCDDIHTINSLYGLFCNEMNLIFTEKDAVTDVMKRMIEFIDKSLAYVKKSNKSAFDTQKLWYDVLMECGKKDMQLIDSVRADISAGRIPNRYRFQRLRSITEAYSYRSGDGQYSVNIGLLGYPKQDGYDKLPHCIPKELSDYGMGLRKKSIICDQYYDGLSLNQIRFNLNNLIYSHIDKINMERVKHYISLFTKMKNDIGNNEVSTNQFDNPMSNFYKQYKKMCEELLPTDFYHEDGEKQIHDILSGFLKTYKLGDKPGTKEPGFPLNKLPLKLQNDLKDCIKTSLIIRDAILQLPDSEHLDYSVSVISLTKSLEIVLDYICNTGEEKKKYDTIGSYIEQLKREKSTARKNVDLNKLNDLSASIEYDNDDKKTTVNFTYSVDKNLDQLIDLLNYIRKNYRNKVAHKEIIKAEDAKNCRNLLLLEHYVICILLYIIK